MQIIIRNILRERNVIDNGISEAITAALEPAMVNAINQEITLFNTAVECMNGILSDGNYKADELPHLSSLALDSAQQLILAYEKKKIHSAH